jgi:hypothetical protein
MKQTGFGVALSIVRYELDGRAIEVPGGKDFSLPNSYQNGSGAQLALSGQLELLPWK